MKKVLLFSAVFVFGLVCNCELYAQSACQPNPACKAICTGAKTGMRSDAAPTALTAVAMAVPVSQQSAVTAPSGTKAACNPANCDPSKCDPTNCDPSKCDMTKCDPSKCMPAKCSGSGKTRI